MTCGFVIWETDQTGAFSAGGRVTCSSLLVTGAFLVEVGVV